MEDYLKTIYHLQYDTDERIRTAAIAEELDVTSPTVTSMIDTLEEQSLVDREKYRGVRLTKKGEQVALEVIRHHRLLETFLTEHLDYDWTEVHDEADRLEHHISEDFEKRMAAALDNPTVDPHGDPIPNVDLEPPRTQETKSLLSFEEGDAVVVQQVSDRDPEILEYLSNRGIEPGTKLTILDIAPFGMITAEPHCNVDSVSLPEDVAGGIRVSAASNGR